MPRKCLLLAVILFISCDKKQEKGNSVIQPISISEKNSPKIDIHECTTAKDTLFTDGDWIKYIQLEKNTYGIEVRFKGITDTLDGYVFNCNAVNSLIPKILRKDKDLILTQGQGFTYRNTIVCRKESYKLLFSQFESDRTHQDSYDYLVFETNGKFCFYNRKDNKEFYKNIPAEFNGIKVTSSEIYNNKIVVHFENKKTLTVNLPKRSK